MALSLLGSDNVDDGFDDLRFSEGGNVAELVDFVGGDFAEEAAHDLARASLGETGNNVDAIRHGDTTNVLADLTTEFAGKRVTVSVGVEAVLENAEGVDGLAFDLVSDTDDSGFSAGGVRDEGRFEFSSAEAMTRDVDNVVDAADDPMIAISVAEDAVASEEAAGVREEVGLAEALMVAPNGTSHAGPRTVYSEHAADVLAGKRLTRGGIEKNRLDTEEGLAAGARFHASGARQGSHHDSS